jgi:hypothetical protein
MTFEIDNSYIVFANKDEFKVEIFKGCLEEDALRDLHDYNLKIQESNIDCYEIVGEFTNLSEFIIDYQLSDMLEKQF